MRVAFYEDQLAANFGPLAALRPVFELLCGHFPLRERLLRCWEVTDWGAFLRSHLVETYREEQPEAHVNEPEWLLAGQTLMINGRWLPSPADLDEIRGDQIGYCEETLVYAVLDPDEAQVLYDGNWDRMLETLALTRKRREVGGRVFRYPWELLHFNEQQLIDDFALQRLGHRVPANSAQVAVQGNESQIDVHPTAHIDPFVVLDARSGPIAIAAGAQIQPFTRIAGPCYIGRDTQLFRAHVKAGTSLGPVCRVGGEIEASILIGYTNKYHDGFLGHSYVGSWVNLGAQTVTSDLKVDYSDIRVPLAGEMLDTRQMKVGSFIGDYTKTGINTVFNTGTSIGVMCLILPDGDYAPRYVPSFCSARGGQLNSGFPLERTLAAARAANARRGKELTSASERLLRHLFLQTRAEREQALARGQRIVESPAL